MKPTERIIISFKEDVLVALAIRDQAFCPIRVEESELSNEGLEKLHAVEKPSEPTNKPFLHSECPSCYVVRGVLTTDPSARAAYERPPSLVAQ